MSGGLELAFDLVLRLGKKSYLTRDGNYAVVGNRKSDVPADDLLLELTKRLKEKDGSFNFADAFSELNKSRKEFAMLDIYSRPYRHTGFFVHRYVGDLPPSDHDTFFTKSYELMWSYLEGPEVVQNYHYELKAKISEAHADIKKETMDCNEKGGFEYSSYKLSKKMQEYVQVVRRYGYMSGTSRQAFELALHLAKSSYTRLPSIFGGYNYQQSDPAIDALVVEMGKLFKEADDNFDFTQTVSDLSAEIDFMQDREVTTYLPRSYKHMTSWLPGAKARKKAVKKQPKATSQFDKTQQKVLTKSRAQARHFEELIDRRRVPIADVLSHKIRPFIPEVSQLSEMPGGLLPSIELALFLGKHFSWYGTSL